MEVFGGIEGGGSRSTASLFNLKGELLASVQGPGTNHWQIGVEVCAGRIYDMVKNVKEALPTSSVTLISLGMALSGIESEQEGNNVVDHLKLNFPDLAKNYYVTNDTSGSLYTAASDGGMVLIAGTGSNCILVNPEGDYHKCGGWGHMLGDEGSAYWIALRAVKTVFDIEDNLIKASTDIACVKAIVQEHFNTSERRDVLPHLYTNFSKAFIAKMCIAVSKGALETKDELCCSIFRDAGRVLAAHVCALLPKLATTLPEKTLKVICVGSVWKSWAALKDGFDETLALQRKTNSVNCIQLLRLNQSSDLGAAFLGAKVAGYTFPINYALNSNVFWHTELSN